MQYGIAQSESEGPGLAESILFEEKPEERSDV